MLQFDLGGVAHDDLNFGENSWSLLRWLPLVV